MMTKPAQSQKTLQQLTESVTAFRTWRQFAEAMDNGYQPTLVPAPGRDKWTRQYNRDVAELAYRIEELGYRVFRGCGKK